MIVDQIYLHGNVEKQLRKFVQSCKGVTYIKGAKLQRVTYATSQVQQDTIGANWLPFVDLPSIRLWEPGKPRQAQLYLVEFGHWTG